MTTFADLLAVAQTAYEQQADSPPAERLRAAGLAVVLGSDDPRLLAGLITGPLVPVSLAVEPAQAAEWLAGVTVDDGRLAHHRARRRGLGAYYTPSWLVSRLADLVSPLHGSALDPACGAGAFLVELLRRGVTDLHGVDGDPLAVLAARRALVAAGLGVDDAVARVRLGDGLLDPSLRGRFSLVIGNPPWGLAFDRGYRARLADAGLLDAGEPSSEAAFLRAAHSQVAPGGRVAFVLPESWLSTRRGRSLRRWLLASTAVERIEVYRKGVFASARDMVPVLLVTQRAAPASGTAVAWHGLSRPLTTDPTALAERVVDPLAWRHEPDSVFALGVDDGLRGAARLDDLASLHDGFYKSHLRPSDDGEPMLTAARQVRPFALDPLDSLARMAVDGLPSSELARQRRPKLLVHAMRKPALAQRIVAAADPDGAYLASNNLLMVIPRDDCPWSLAALAALLNSGPVNRWYAARFIQVNIEAFTLGAVPLPVWSAEAEAALLGASADQLDSVVLALYGG